MHSVTDRQTDGQTDNIMMPIVAKTGALLVQITIMIKAIVSCPKTYQFQKPTS